jgi:hypothetical protein
MSKVLPPTVSIPPSLLSELEAWGKWTAKLFGRLRRQSEIGSAMNPNDQAWYWSREWQHWEQQAEQDVAAGRVKEFARVDDLIADLNV